MLDKDYWTYNSQPWLVVNNHDESSLATFSCDARRSFLRAHDLVRCISSSPGVPTKRARSLGWYASFVTFCIGVGLMMIDDVYFQVDSLIDFHPRAPNLYHPNLWRCIHSGRWSLKCCLDPQHFLAPSPKLYQFCWFNGPSIHKHQQISDPKFWQCNLLENATARQRVLVLQQLVPRGRSDVVKSCVEGPLRETFTPT